MYKVLCDDKPIHDLNVNGLVLDSPKLTLEDNQINTFDFTIQPNHPMYDFIQKMTSKIKVMRDDDELFNGIIKEEKVGFRKSRVCHCESELSYLKNTTQPQAEYHDMTVRGFLETLLQNHNSFSEEKFEVGMVTVTDPNDSLYRFTNFESTLEAISKKLIEKLGGHLRIRKENGIRYLDYLADTQKKNVQTIEFGKNLIDFTKNYDMTNIITSVIPLGAKIEDETGQSDGKKALEKRLEITEVNSGKNYLINQNTIDGFGFIQKVIKFDDVHSAEILMKKGKKYLEDNQFENLVIEVKALDLHLLNPDIQPIDVLDSVQVISKPHGLNRFFPVTKREIPLLHPENETFTLGIKTQKTLTDIQNSSNSAAKETLESLNIPNKQGILTEAKENASQLIHNALNGHVVTGPDEVLVMDTADKNTATNVWRWNLNGLGYSNTGYNGQYGLAMTMDGHIVGDRITAGSIDASKLSIEYKNSVDQTMDDKISNSLSNYVTSTEFETKLKVGTSNISQSVSSKNMVEFCTSKEDFSGNHLDQGYGWKVRSENVIIQSVTDAKGEIKKHFKIPVNNYIVWDDARIRTIDGDYDEMNTVHIEFDAYCLKSPDSAEVLVAIDSLQSRPSTHKYPYTQKIKLTHTEIVTPQPPNTNTGLWMHYSLDLSLREYVDGNHKVYFKYESGSSVRITNISISLPRENFLKTSNVVEAGKCTINSATMTNGLSYEFTAKGLTTFSDRNEKYIKADNHSFTFYERRYPNEYESSFMSLELNENSLIYHNAMLSATGSTILGETGKENMITTYVSGGKTYQTDNIGIATKLYKGANISWMVKKNNDKPYQRVFEYALEYAEQARYNNGSVSDGVDVPMGNALNAYVPLYMHNKLLTDFELGNFQFRTGAGMKSGVNGWYTIYTETGSIQFKISKGLIYEVNES